MPSVLHLVMLCYSRSKVKEAVIIGPLYIVPVLLKLVDKLTTLLIYLANVIV